MTNGRSLHDGGGCAGRIPPRRAEIKRRRDRDRLRERSINAGTAARTSRRPSVASLISQREGGCAKPSVAAVCHVTESACSSTRDRGESFRTVADHDGTRTSSPSCGQGAHRSISKRVRWEELPQGTKTIVDFMQPRTRRWCTTTTRRDASPGPSTAYVMRGPWHPDRVSRIVLNPGDSIASIHPTSPAVNKGDSRPRDWVRGGRGGGSQGPE